MRLNPQEIRSYLQKKSFLENFIFCAALRTANLNFACILMILTHLSVVTILLQSRLDDVYHSLTNLQVFPTMP